MTTHAAVHDAKPTEDLVDDSDIGQELNADSAYQPCLQHEPLRGGGKTRYELSIFNTLIINIIPPPKKMS